MSDMQVAEVAEEVSEPTVEFQESTWLDFVLITIAVAFMLSLVYASIIAGCGATGLCLQ